MSVRSSSEWVAAFHMYERADISGRAGDSFRMKHLVLDVLVCFGLVWFGLVGSWSGPVQPLSPGPSRGPIITRFLGPKEGPIICVTRAPN